MKKNIFRAYDIRGIYDLEFNSDDSYIIGRAFGSMLLELGKEKTVVGYDNRHSSVEISNNLIKGIIESGINVINLGLVTTPMLYFSYDHLQIDSGIMVTASHNPKEYNGFKISFNGIYNADETKIYEFRDYVFKGEFKEGLGTVKNVSIKNDYIKYLTKDISICNKLKTVIDCGGGTPSIIIKDVINNLNVDSTYLYCESDPDFSNHHPDPSVSSNLSDLRDVCIKNKIYGFAFDGDGDRIGVVDELGNIIKPDILLALLARYIIKDSTNKKVVYDVNCSNALQDEIFKLGGTPVVSRTGDSYIRKTLYEENMLLGGEFSGHIFINDKFSGFDDAVYVAIRLMEIIESTNKPLYELLKGINKYYNTETIKIKTTDEAKFLIVDKIKNYATKNGINFLDVDGVKIVYDDYFVLIRPSNTEPIVSVRMEANNEEKLEELKEKWLKKINEFI